MEMMQKGMNKALLVGKIAVYIPLKYWDDRDTFAFFDSPLSTNLVPYSRSLVFLRYRGPQSSHTSITHSLTIMVRKYSSFCWLKMLFTSRQKSLRWKSATLEQQRHRSRLSCFLVTQRLARHSRNASMRYSEDQEHYHSDINKAGNLVVVLRDSPNIGH